MPTATLVQHKHCAACGRAILPSQVTCGGECETKWARVGRNRRWFWRGWFIATGLIILLVVAYGPK